MTLGKNHLLEEAARRHNREVNLERFKGMVFVTCMFAIILWVAL